MGLIDLMGYGDWRQRPGVSRKETQAAPLKGELTLKNERRVGAVKPSHIGEGLVRVDVSFASFLCAKEKEG